MTAASTPDAESGGPRFEIGICPGGDESWHAIDAARRLIPASAWADERPGGGAVTVCGLRAQHIASLGGFSYDNRVAASQRCARCSWVVALNRGTVEQEIDFYTGSSPARVGVASLAASAGLLRDIFTAILADAPPGPEAQSGHRSDLLAHATRHRPVMHVCENCAEVGSAAVHGSRVCPEAMVVCGECSFTAQAAAGETVGSITGECVVSAPCSVQHAFAAHYGVADHPIKGAESR